MFIPKIINDKKTEFVSENTNRYICLSTMKKAASIFLLSIFLINTVGYFIVFKVAQLEARKEIKFKIKLGIPDRELTAIEFKKSDLQNIHWVKENKEFYYGNKLFDVVKKDEKVSSVVFYCIDDKQEQVLFSSLDEQVNTFITSHKPKSKSSSKKLNEHVVKIYFSNSFDFKFITSTNLVNYSISAKNYSSDFPEINSPPPEFI